MLLYFLVTIAFGGATLMYAGAALALASVAYAIASGVVGEKLNAVYQEEYEKGLKHISRDGTTSKIFVDDVTGAGADIADDEIQWYNEVINGIWFDQVNIGVRQGNTMGFTSFIPPFQYSNRAKFYHFRRRI